MDISVSIGRHHPEAVARFPRDILDAYYDADVLTAFYGQEWLSVVITHGPRTFHNVVPRGRIPGTDWWDIEPFHGYAGPVVNAADRSFVRDAIEAYRQTCRAAGIVAELIRFHPLLGNAAAFTNVEGIVVKYAKPVVAVPVAESDELQIRACNEPCRRRIRRGLATLRFQQIEGRDRADLFRTLYSASIERVQADARWQFDDSFFRRINWTAGFGFYQVVAGDTPVAAALALFHRHFAHYVLAGTIAGPPAGASELLIFGLLRVAAQRGCRTLILGGGTTNSPDDSLLRFKRKFVPNVLDFHIGQVVHDQEKYCRLIEHASTSNPKVMKSPLFLKYRANS